MITNPNALIGPGGAPTRATTLPDDAAERKKYPLASGVLDYFPDALLAVARVSWEGNNQHNPGKSLRWDRAKSGDESDCIARHFSQRGTIDTDGMRHSAKLAWRALALLQKEIEAEQAGNQAFRDARTRLGVVHCDGETAHDEMIRKEAERVRELEPAKALYNHGTHQFEELAPNG